MPSAVCDPLTQGIQVRRNRAEQKPGPGGASLVSRARCRLNGRRSATPSYGVESCTTKLPC